jgi:tRNA (pseudouridine54-N1)-methyltransferase
MRRFVIVGHKTVAHPFFTLDDIVGRTGRLDILIRCVNAAFCISHAIRKDVVVYLILLGEEGPKTVKFVGKELKYLNPDERSTAALVRTALMKKIARGEEINSTPGVYLCGKDFSDIIEECAKKSDIIVLDEKAPDIRSFKFMSECTFVLSDERDLTSAEKQILTNINAKSISVGPISLHANHCITIIHNELDRIGSGGNT